MSQNVNFAGSGGTVEQNDLDPTSVPSGGVIPNDPNPTNGKGIPFSLSVDNGIVSADIDESFNDLYEFNPVYYPDRFTDTLETEVERDARQCGGEDVTIDKQKNPEFHATGIVLAGNVGDFRKIRNYKGPVNLITPLTDNEGGMEVVVTKGEIGELVGWDGLYKQWQFNYTLDMVATGSDTSESSESQIVSEILEEYRE